MAKLYILCGPSGSGKSTWARNFMHEHEVSYISRDDVRLSIIKDEEDYFSHEKEVFKKFVQGIAVTLQEDKSIIADATHLNMFSRCKLLQAVDMYIREYEVIYVVFNTDLDTCIARNSNRTGRRYVPETVIRNMCRDFRHPTMDEDDRVKEIIEV